MMILGGVLTYSGHPDRSIPWRDEHGMPSPADAPSPRRILGIWPVPFLSVLERKMVSLRGNTKKCRSESFETPFSRECRLCVDVDDSTVQTSHALRQRSQNAEHNTELSLSTAWWAGHLRTQTVSWLFKETDYSNKMATAIIYGTHFHVKIKMWTGILICTLMNRFT